MSTWFSSPPNAKSAMLTTERNLQKKTVVVTQANNSVYCCAPQQRFFHVISLSKETGMPPPHKLSAVIILNFQTSNFKLQTSKCRQTVFVIVSIPSQDLPNHPTTPKPNQTVFSAEIFSRYCPTTYRYNVWLWCMSLPAGRCANDQRFGMMRQQVIVLLKLITK